MWYIKRVSNANSEFVSVALELLQSVSRRLIISTSIIYVVWHIVATLTWPEIFIDNMWFITPLFLISCGLALWLLPRHLLLAQVVWQVGLLATITLAFYIFQQAEIVFLYTILPLMAVVTVGRRGGLLAETAIIFLIWLFSYNQALPLLPIGYIIATIGGGIFTGLLGWVTSQVFLTVARWSLYSFNQAQKNLAEANQHRAEVVRVLKNLDQTYYQLERANHTLVLARAKAEEAQASRDRFTLAVSHELRSPLNFILGFSEMMVNDPETYDDLAAWPPGLYEDIEEIYRSSTHLSGLVNDILSLGQIEARQMALFKEVVVLKDLLNEVQKMVEPVLKRKGLWLKTEIDPNLSPVFVDATRIRQVLLNLVTNSSRFTEQGGITVCMQQQQNFILITVKDTGLGIAKQDISKVFEIFRQVGEVNWRRQQGTGLGIPISKRFIELHGGQMWVESEVDIGTSFFFTLPIAGSSVNNSTNIESTQQDLNTTDDYWQILKEKAIQEQLLFVLSPDPVAGELMSQYVHPYKIVALNKATKVWSKMVELLPTALIVDHNIFNEVSVQQVLQKLPYNLPVVSLVFPSSTGHKRQLPSNVINYLIKPITRQQLATTVKTLGPHVKTILVVDDDPAMVRFVKMSLANDDEYSQQYTLLTATSGLEALNVLHKQVPDAIFLDPGLGDINGWELLKRLKKNEQFANVPIVIITAHELPQKANTQQQEALRVLMNRPLSRQELSTVLQTLLDTVAADYPTQLSSIQLKHQAIPDA